MEQDGRFSAIPFGGYVKFFGDHNVFSDFNREELRKQYSEEDQKKLLAFKAIISKKFNRIWWSFS